MAKIEKPLAGQLPTADQNPEANLEAESLTELHQALAKELPSRSGYFQFLFTTSCCVFPIDIVTPLCWT